MRWVGNWSGLLVPVAAHSGYFAGLVESLCYHRSDTGHAQDSAMPKKAWYRTLAYKISTFIVSEGGKALIESTVKGLLGF
jgi:hypothetical protein